MFSVSHFLVLSFTIIFTQGNVSVHNPFYCYSQDPIKPQNSWFGIHTAYDIARGQTINPNVSTCNPSKFWLMSRHGARLPNPIELANIFANEIIHRETLSNYDQGRTSLCASDIELLKNWQFDPNITLDRADELVPAGWNEVEGMASRFQAAFPTILSSTYSNTTYFFRASDFQRTQVSLHAFADGLFGVNGHEQIQLDEVIAPDYLLRAYTQCPLYNEIILDQNQRDAFREGPEYQEMITQVSAKLGFHGSHVLRNNEVVTLGQICKYEQIWDLNSTSAFCSAFSVANRRVIEYFDDLDFYYRLGYGKPEYRKLLENLVCFNMQDLLRFLQSTDEQRARIFSGHITVLPLILINLGAFDGDVPLTQHNFAQQTERAWRSSVTMPMAANLAVIRYDCADDNDLLFLYNEIPLQIPGCDSNGVCKQSFILDKFNHFLNANCEEVFCSNF